MTHTVCPPGASLNSAWETSQHFDFSSSNLFETHDFHKSTLHTHCVSLVSYLDWISGSESNATACRSPYDQRLLIVMKHFTKITMLLLLTIRTTPLHQQMWKSVSVDGVFFFQVFYLDFRIVVHPGRNCSVGWICQCSGQECLLVMDG